MSGFAFGPPAVEEEVRWESSEIGWSGIFRFEVSVL
jgi:hypothetical protein